MGESMDITFLVCSFYVISVQVEREKSQSKKQELYNLKKNVVSHLFRRKLSKKLGLYHDSYSNDIVVLYSVQNSQTDEIFYLFVSPSGSELNALPTIEGYFNNPNPKYMPTLYHAFDSLKKFVTVPLPKPPSKKQTVNVQKRTNKWKRTIFASSYLDAKEPFGPYY